MGGDDREAGAELHEAGGKSPREEEVNESEKWGSRLEQVPVAQLEEMLAAYRESSASGGPKAEGAKRMVEAIEAELARRASGRLDS
jgi:hypothetical protein